MWSFNREGFLDHRSKQDVVIIGPGASKENLQAQVLKGQMHLIFPLVKITCKLKWEISVSSKFFDQWLHLPRTLPTGENNEEPAAISELSLTATARSSPDKFSHGLSKAIRFALLSSG